MTDMELRVLGILFGSEKPLTPLEVSKADSTLNYNTVQVKIRDLLQAGYVEVADVVKSGKALCRCYKPTAKAQEQVEKNVSSQIARIRKNLPLHMLVSCLFHGDDQDETIQELEKMIKEKKASL
jgi:predicted transcriptional regulator